MSSTIQKCMENIMMDCLSCAHISAIFLRINYNTIANPKPPAQIWLSFDVHWHFPFRNAPSMTDCHLWPVMFSSASHDLCSSQSSSAQHLLPHSGISVEDGSLDPPLQRWDLKFGSWLLIEVLFAMPRYTNHFGFEHKFCFTVTCSSSDWFIVCYSLFWQITYILSWFLCEYAHDLCHFDDYTHIVFFYP